MYTHFSQSKSPLSPQSTSLLRSDPPSSDQARACPQSSGRMAEVAIVGTLTACAERNRAEQGIVRSVRRCSFRDGGMEERPDYGDGALQDA